jgi:uncharacterized protein (DUF58 family)
VLSGIIVFFFVGYGIRVFFDIALLLLAMLVLLFIVDLVLLYFPKFKMRATRTIPELFTLGDDNKVKIRLVSSYPFNLMVHIIDELPFQLQERNFELSTKLKGNDAVNFDYEITPHERGEYQFGFINVFIHSPIQLVKKRIQSGEPQVGKVFPSISQMKKYEILALARISTLDGVKKIRRIGHNYEFDQIKNYVVGDDIRAINWKATGKRNQLMVNQYQDERSQAVYVFIDKSRSMEMRFNNMRYLDYAINSALVMLNIALKKYDKAGLMTFSDKIGASLKADRSKLQLKRILEQLYREKPSEKEANYDLMMRITRKMLNGRSLILLYTNFESIHALERQLPYLRRLNKMHLLVVVFFEDKEIEDFSHSKIDGEVGVYQRILAGKYVSEKRKMQNILMKHRIQTILTTPENLSIDSLNKYLELKARGLI